MTKIVLIGAGSHVFSRHLITDIVSYPELRDCTIALEGRVVVEAGRIVDPAMRAQRVRR